MDAIKFIEEKERMCKTCGSCVLCPAWLDDGCIVNMRRGFAPEQQINTVKTWAEMHPRKTRQSLFLEQYPEALLDVNGLLDVCPAPIFLSHRLVGGGCRDPHKKCIDCKREFWLQEVEQKER